MKPKIDYAGRVVSFYEPEGPCVLLAKNSNMLENFFTFFASITKPHEAKVFHLIIKEGIVKDVIVFKVNIPGIESDTLKALIIYLDLNLIFYRNENKG